MNCWPKGFIPCLINLQLFAPKLIKWLPVCGVCRLVIWQQFIMTWSYCLHRRYSIFRQKNSTLVNKHALNREPVPLTWDQALLLLLLFFVSLAREGKSNACYIQLTSRQPLPRLHNLMFAWPAMLLANHYLPDGNQILARSLFLAFLHVICDLMITCYSKFNTSTSHVNKCFESCFIGFLIMLQCTNVCLIWIYFASK